MSDAMSGKQALMRYGSLVAGPLLCLIIFLSMPSSYVTADGSVAEFSQAGRACLGVLVWMAIWWCFETAPIAVTSLLPMVLFPLLGVCKPAAAMARYDFPFYGRFHFGCRCHQVGPRSPYCPICDELHRRHAEENRFRHHAHDGHALGLYE